MFPNSFDLRLDLAAYMIEARLLKCQFGDSEDGPVMLYLFGGTKAGAVYAERGFDAHGKTVHLELLEEWEYGRAPSDTGPA